MLAKNLATRRYIETFDRVVSSLSSIKYGSKDSLLKIAIFFTILFTFLLSEEAVHSTRLIETGTFQEWLTRQDSNPYFDTSVPSNMTGLVGKTIQLVCRVKNLGNRTVSTLVIDSLL